MHPQIADDLFQTILAQVAVATVQLQGLVRDLEAGVGDVALGHRAQLDLVGVVGVQRTRGPPQHHSRRLEPGGHVGQGEPDRGLVEQGRAEGLSLANVGARFVEGGLRAAERARRDVEPAAVEALHRDAEAGALTVRAAQHRVGGHPHALQDHLRGGLRVPAHLLFERTETQSRSALFDDERRYAARAGLFWASRSCHHHVDVGGSRAGNELLDAVEHIVAALLDGAGAQRAGVGSGARLGQAVAGDDIHRRQAAESIPCVARRCRRCRSSTRTCCGWTGTRRSSGQAMANCSKIRTPSRRRSPLPPTSSRQ